MGRRRAASACPRDDIERIAPVQAAAVKAEISVRPWAHFVDTRPLLSPDGEYVTYLPDDSGNDVKVREGDGVHPNLAGARRMISTTAEALITERKLEQALAAATTTTTTTRSTGSSGGGGGGGDGSGGSGGGGGGGGSGGGTTTSTTGG